MPQKTDLTLYLGGTRSGKSTQAERHVQAHAKGPIIYVATAQSRASDPSMQRRIMEHSQRRPEHWVTLECTLHLAEHIATSLEKHGIVCHKNADSEACNEPSNKQAESTIPQDPHCPTILIDCVTMWVSNILFSLPKQNDAQLLEKAMRHEIEQLLVLIHKTACRWVIVSGETGLGGIACSPIERAYHDALGLANQLIGLEAHDAFLAVAGRVVRLEKLMP